MYKIKEEERRRKMRNNQLDKKFDRSQQVVDDYKRNQDHKLMLV